MNPQEATILQLTKALEEVTRERDAAIRERDGLRGCLGVTLGILDEVLAKKAAPGALGHLMNSLRELHDALAKTVEAEAAT